MASLKLQLQQHPGESKSNSGSGGIEFKNPNPRKGIVREVWMAGARERPVSAKRGWDIGAPIK